MCLSSVRRQIRFVVDPFVCFFSAILSILDDTASSKKTTLQKKDSHSVPVSLVSSVMLFSSFKQAQFSINRML